jgi:hypothetical protein
MVGTKMIEVIFGDYKLQQSDQLLGYFSTDFLFKSKLSENKTYVMFAEDCGIDKKKLELIKEHAQTNIKIITMDSKLYKGMRSSKNFKITKNADDEPSTNPFDLVKAIITCDDRQYILDYLKKRKENLYMVIKVLTSNYSQLTDRNKKMSMFLDKYFNKCSNEILYHIIAFLFDKQKTFWCKWNFPKKKSEEKAES